MGDVLFNLLSAVFPKKFFHSLHVVFISIFHRLSYVHLNLTQDDIVGLFSLISAGGSATSERFTSNESQRRQGHG